MKPPFAATREQVRELDRIAIGQYGLPGLMLMENAGHRCALHAADMLGGAAGKKVAVLCGPGNNGGDGFVLARHLTNWGAQVRVILLGQTSRVLEGAGETSVNLDIILKMGIPVREAPCGDDFARELAACQDAQLLVDALPGTGLTGSVREPFLCAISGVNAAGRPVLAVDVPSGLDCNTGRPLGAAVRADRTVTFVLNKIGFTAPGAAEFTGRVEVAEISIPRRLIEEKLREWQSEAT